MVDNLLSFLDTFDLKFPRDLIASQSGLSTWLAGRSYIGIDDVVSIEDVARAVEFREALREIVAANAGGPPSPSAMEALNRTARGCSLRIQLAETGTARIVPAGIGLDAAIGDILSEIYTSVANGTWPRVKTCGNPSCRKAFYDHSRNRSGLWCEMATCGNRLKARRYRVRHPRS